MKHYNSLSASTLYRVSSINYVTGRCATLCDGICDWNEALRIANRFEDSAVKPSPLYFDISRYTK